MLLSVISAEWGETFSNRLQRQPQPRTGWSPAGTVRPRGRGHWEMLSREHSHVFRTVCGGQAFPGTVLNQRSSGRASRCGTGKGGGSAKWCLFYFVFQETTCFRQKGKRQALASETDSIFYPPSHLGSGSDDCLQSSLIPQSQTVQSCLCFLLLESL